VKKNTASTRTRKRKNTHSIREMPHWTVGVDVGDQHSVLCVVDVTGEIVEEGRIRTTPDAFERRFSGMDKSRVVIETGCHARWIEETLVTAGHEVVVANARSLYAISKSPRKNDENDAQLLARLGRADPTLLDPVQHRSAAAQQGLTLVRSRDALVRARTALVNCVRGIVKSVGARLPSCDPDDFPLHADKLPAGVADALKPLMAQIDHLNKAIAEQSKTIAKEMDTIAPGARNLTTIPGVGPLTAVTFALTIDDPKRFPTSRTVGAYLGLVPRQYKSGESNPELGISKAGSTQMRRLLVQCAHVLMTTSKSDCDLREWGTKLAGTSKGNKRRAVVGVARKLAVLMHKMLVTGKPFDPRYNTKRKESQQKAPALAA
jgi:transposase